MDEKKTPKVKLQWVWSNELGWIGICPVCYSGITEDKPMTCTKCGVSFYSTSKPTVNGRLCYY